MIFQSIFLYSYEVHLDFSKQVVATTTTNEQTNYD